MTRKPPAANPDTATHILDAAERLVQTRGFNGFSYADIAAEVGITKASLHYHFPTKAELGCALIVRYTRVFEEALTRISADLAGARARLDAYVKLYADVLADERMCLCGMVAAEYATLPAPMQGALRVFFDHNERWLAALLDQGAREGALTLRSSAAAAAAMLLAALEGGMLVARAYGDASRFESAARLVLEQLVGAATAGVKSARPRRPYAHPRATHPAGSLRTKRR